MFRSILLVGSLCVAATQLQGQPFAFTNGTPEIDRWMYPFNSAPCDRTAGSTFGAFGEDTLFDTREAQHIVGWNTSASAPTNRGPARYLIRHCRVVVTLNRGDIFEFDPTQDDYRTYFPTNDPAYLPDADAGRPMELFGVDYRNEFTTDLFEQCSPFGGFDAPAKRNAYAAGWSTNGTLVDVSNNVGKTNLTEFPRFEVAPFSIGQASVTAGELVPAASEIKFDLNLSDPFVMTYLQRALNEGRLRFTLTSLHRSQGQLGTATYPDFVTSFNSILPDPTRLELEGVAISETDSDTDGLGDDWENFYFGSLTNDPNADLDGDRLTNEEEQETGTDPVDLLSTLALSLERNADGQVNLTAAHAASRTYEIQVSGNLRDWISLTNAPTYNLFAGTVRWTEALQSSTNRYYRLVTTLILE